MKFVCPRCLNNDRRYFAKINGKFYCRKCLCFVGRVADIGYLINKGAYSIGYSLTKEQTEASDFVFSNVMAGKNCALNAVCGAGKTEIIYKTIEYCLNNNLKIGVAIPRKDVVIELRERMAKDFNVNVIGVYGGCNEVLEADIVIFTTHQAYRYINYFDVLIVDEVDAFPYKGSDVLKNIISRCGRVFVYLSATMPEYIVNDKSINKFYLNKRYHGYKLPVPICKERIFMAKALKHLLVKYKNRVVLVYFPTIILQSKIAKKIKCDYLINSKVENRDVIVNKLRKMKNGVIFTTTVLERGITINGVQVVVYDAGNSLFDKSTLIQIAGRVGRSKECPGGDVIFLCKEKSKEIISAIKSLRRANE